MRAHWTARYLRDRARLAAWHLLRPSEPWWTRDAVRVLDKLLRPSDVVIEFGCGRSTLWLARRVGRLISIENVPPWHAQTLAALRRANINHCDLRLVLTPAPLDETRESPAYVAALREAADQSIDAVAIDGGWRDFCAAAALRPLRSGGLLIIDNANWWLPSGSVAPASCAPDELPRSETWVRFWKAVEGWRRAWFGDGVTDTLILFKP